MNQNITNNARKLRKRQTKAESLLWDKVRAKKFHNLKFKRQVPLEFNYEDKDRVLFADFICYELNLVIELDGSSHDDRKEYDRLRDKVCESLGFVVLRVQNQDVVENIDGVLELILSFR